MNPASISLPTPTPSYGYSRKHRAVEALCIAAVFGFLVAFCVQVPRTLHTTAGWVTLALTGLAAYIAADIVSGVVHWGGDTLGHERVWFLGPNFIRPFREHHVDQKAITRHDFIETNGNNCIVVLGPLGLAFFLMPDDASIGFFASSFVAFLALFVVATNQFHKWAHADKPPAFARPLQRWGLILSPRHHEIHHTVPHHKHYCITVGWMNPILNGVHFFRAAEWLIARVRPTWLHIEERTLFAAQQAAAALATKADAAAGVNSPDRSAPSH
ncbi:MAG: fatty acid desaturase CarF family protein [Pseudomonadota bacterium]